LILGRTKILKRVKITVVKRAWNDDLAKKYAAPDLGPCGYHKEGEAFYSNGWQKPEGLIKFRFIGTPV
jgi:uncharacterized repeat protein (TIGR04076 family)